MVTWGRSSAASYDKGELERSQCAMIVEKSVGERGAGAPPSAAPQIKPHWAATETTSALARTVQNPKTAKLQTIFTKENTRRGKEIVLGQGENIGNTLPPVSIGQCFVPTDWTAPLAQL